MKKLSLILSIIFSALFIFSCSSQEKYKIAGNYPMQDLNTKSMFNMIATTVADQVTGTATVSLEGNNSGVYLGDTKKYAVLDYYSINWQDGIFQIPKDSPGFLIALSNATFEMQEKAKNLGASFLLYPSYSIEISDNDMVTVKTYATAIKLVNISEETLKDIVNHSSSIVELN